jgi:hypothetical protein
MKTTGDILISCKFCNAGTYVSHLEQSIAFLSPNGWAEKNAVIASSRLEYETMGIDQINSKFSVLVLYHVGYPRLGFDYFLNRFA